MYNETAMPVLWQNCHILCARVIKYFRLIINITSLIDIYFLLITGGRKKFIKQEKEG